MNWERIRLKEGWRNQFIKLSLTAGTLLFIRGFIFGGFLNRLATLEQKAKNLEINRSFVIADLRYIDSCEHREGFEETEPSVFLKLLGT